MTKIRFREVPYCARVLSRIQRNWWKVVGLLVGIWIFGVYFRQYIPFSFRRDHEVREIDIGFEERISKGEISPFNAHGFLEQWKAARYCEAHNWKAFPRRDYRRKIYDLVMVNTELDWLEIRLNELHGHVDYFVVLESATTFTGHPKPLAVKDNWPRFEKFSKQIIYHLLDSNDVSVQSNISWDHERHQRNAMYTQVLPFLSKERKPQLDDIILISDLDEIPRPASLTLLRNCEFPLRLTLRSQFYYYSFQWRHHGPEWAHPQATIYQGEDTILPADLRGGVHGLNRLKHLDEKGDLWNAAWHCSSCFSTIEEMQTKISSFSHVEFDKPEFKDKRKLAERVRLGKDLFDRRGERYDRVESNEDIPWYMRENRGDFGYMLDRDGGNAGFVDYEP